MTAITTIVEKLKPPLKLPEAVPPDINDRVKRAAERMHKDRNLRRLCQLFFENKQYWMQTTAGNLTFQTSGMVGVVGPDKTSYRIRNTYNFVGSIVEAKVSAATGQIPGYEVDPSTDDPDDQAAAHLAEQVAVFGYDQWRLRSQRVKAFTNAFVQREGFVMPYFDPNVGPYEQQPDGTYLGQGEVRVLNLTRDEVGWEPGVDFEDSPFWIIVRGRLKDEVRRMPGYVGGSLETDAEGAELPEGKKSDQMVVVTEYLERPSAKYPQGRRCFIAAGKIIVDYRRDPNAEEDADWWEPYPLMDANGTVCDEPPLHRISYTTNPNGEDLGLVERIIDLQRTINDCWNKLLEWKNRALMPQMSAPRGANVTRRDDTPGATWYYNVVGGLKPDWEQSPRVPQELFQMLETAIQQLRDLTADLDIQADPRVTSATAQIAVSSAQARWQAFLDAAAEFDSRVMRHCLMLVARYYDTNRLIQIRGQYGWEPLPAFTGSDLRSQVHVRVLPGTLQAKSRAQIQQEIQFIQANWPGAITPEAALGVLHGGSAEGLIRSYRNDVAKAWRVVRRLRTANPDDPNVMLSFGERYDPDVPAIDLETGQPIMLPPDPSQAQVDPATGQVMLPPPQQQMGMTVPGWMPGPWDNVQIWRQVVGDYMKTEDFESLAPNLQENFYLIWRGLDESEQMRAAKQAAQQQMQAQSLGMANAGKPQMPPPLPDRAGFTPENQSPVPQA